MRYTYAVLPFNASCMRSEVLMAVMISMFVFLVVTPYGFVGICQRSEEHTASILKAIVLSGVVVSMPAIGLKFREFKPGRGL
jgi:hypothetical protein